MATPLIVGIGAITAAVAARHVMRNGVGFGKKAAQELVKGGFKAKMDRGEAVEILGLKCVLILIAEYRVRGSPVGTCRDTVAGRVKLRDYHRQIMLANHPDRGGSPYIASKINEARDLIEKLDRKV
jgi:DnaJ homolog subfamily C member 19